jgi:pyruvate/2-oxoglutarate/acetoin dehydrogenase E1 component
MKYVEFINDLLKQKVLEPEHVLLFGQNISAGSCLSGFTRGLKVRPGGRIINTPNCENTLCGIGFGSMMNGVPAVFFMKQQDFLLLGIDQLVNTYNIIRRQAPKSSFTIMPVIVDSGYEGPQSALNNFADFCSIARIPGYAVTNKMDAQEIINKHLFAPGFRIIGISQRLFKTEILDLPCVYRNEDRSLFQYTQGQDATIVCFNFSLPYGLEIHRRMSEKDVQASVFSVNAEMPIPWDEIVADVKKTRRVIIIDDSKTVNAPWQALLNALYAEAHMEKHLVIQRSFEGYWCRPHHDQLDINYDKVIADFNVQKVAASKGAR